MKIAVLSGKGGAGKTTIAVSLSLYLEDVTYVDMDAEEPNGHVFHHPLIEKTEEFTRPIPVINTEICTFCGKCQDACQFNAITIIKPISRALVHKDLCHHCGACSYVCPEPGAIVEKEIPVGTLRFGKSGINKQIGFIEARMNSDQASPVSLLSGLNTRLTDDQDYILDAPPGTSCSVVEVLDNADFVVMVSEPTPFGLSDLALSLELVRDIGKAHALIINKQDENNDLARNFAQKNEIEVLGEIPYDKDIALHYADGTLFEKMPHTMITAVEKIVESLKGKLEMLKKDVHHE